MRRLLLISSSYVHGGGYLDHAADEVREFLSSAVKRVVFVPYALEDREAYVRRVRDRFQNLDYEVTSVHDFVRGPRAAVEEAQALFIGGGNTFRLLNEMYRTDLIPAIRERVQQGMPYLGTSAGTNVACPSIKTTNDMPIVYPPSFEALSLVPFNINPHYLDPDPSSKHMGETREQRIKEFHEMNSPPVLGMREGAMLRAEGEQLVLKGDAGARLFRRGQAPIEVEPGTRLDFLLEAPGLE